MKSESKTDLFHISELQNSNLEIHKSFQTIVKINLNDKLFKLYTKKSYKRLLHFMLDHKSLILQIYLTSIKTLRP